jgi:hypothetical protein
MDGDDEVVIVNATYSADILTNNGGVPGSFLGHLVIPGTAQFTYVGRDPSVNPLGTFETKLTEFAFQGSLNNNTFEVKHDPNRTSGGFTTILQATSDPITYTVSGSLDIFALFSFNGSPFMEAPPRTAGLVPAPAPIPEPGSGVLVASVLAGVISIASKRR